MHFESMAGGDVDADGAALPVVAGLDADGDVVEDVPVFGVRRRARKRCTRAGLAWTFPSPSIVVGMVLPTMLFAVRCSICRAMSMMLKPLSTYSERLTASPTSLS